MQEPFDCPPLGFLFLLNDRIVFSYFSCIRSLFLLYVFAGVYAVSSVGPTHQVSTVSGRTTIPTVGHVPVLSLARCAERTSWRRSCFCSVSIAIGGYCSSTYIHAQNKDTATRPTSKPTGTGSFQYFSCYRRCLCDLS